MSIHKKEMEAKRKSKTVTKVDAFSAEGVVKETNNLKLDISKMLDILANKLGDCEKTKIYHINTVSGIWGPGDLQKNISVKIKMGITYIRMIY